MRPESGPEFPEAGGQPQWPAPAAMPPRPAGCGRVLVRMVVFFVLGGSILLNLLLLLGVGSGGDANGVITTVVDEGDPKQIVAVVALQGAIDSASAGRFDHKLDAIEKDERVKALVIEIDSPGGTVTGSDEIHGRVEKYKSNRKAAGRNATVVVAVRGQALSGGYYVACAGDYVFAEQTSSAGNIGVLMSQFNVSKLMEKYGVQDTTVVATGADFKTVGSPFQPESPEGRKYIQEMTDQAFGRFKAVVTAGRGSKLTTQPSNVFNGKIFFGPEALKLGLIDQIGFPEDAIAYAAKTAGVSKPHVVRYSERGPGLLEMLGGGQAAGSQSPPEASSGSMPDLKSLLRPETLDAWRTTRLLYR